MISKIKKILQYIKAKGVILTLLKIWDYILFKIKSKRKVFKTVSIYNDEFAIVTNLKGINLMYKNTLLTNNIGFYSALKNLGKWQDSTNSAWFVQKYNGRELKIKQYWENLPLQQHWSLELKDNKIIWDIILEIENYLSLEGIKVGLMVGKIYNQALVDNKYFDLPPIQNKWEKLNLPLINKAILKSKDISHPDIKFSILDSFLPSRLIIQNTNNYLGGRFLQAGVFKEKEYPAGKYKLFKIIIELIKDEDNTCKYALEV